MKKELQIVGMHCKSCVMLVDDALDELQGVSKSEVEIGKVSVEYDESKIKLETIKKAIENEGFKVK